MNTPSNDGSAHERLIRDLATDLKPVRRLRPASARALGWLAVVATIAIVLAMIADVPALGRRLAAAPDMWLAVSGSAATAILAAFAAFQLSLPDARRAWALLPLPAALLWVVASGVGCLRAWFVPGTHSADLSEARECLIFIVGLSVPLSALLDNDAAACLPAAAGPDGVDCRARLGRRGRHAAQLFSSVRRGSDRPRGARIRGGHSHCGKSGVQRPAARH